MIVGGAHERATYKEWALGEMIRVPIPSFARLLEERTRVVVQEDVVRVEFATH